MARRDRTTGLPRPRPRNANKSQGRFAFGETAQIRAVWIAGGLLIALLLGLLGYKWVNSQFIHPNKTVLTVGEQKFSLSYYTDRLFLSAQANSGSGANVSILEQTLFTDLENEAISRIIAEERGITVTDEEITAEIASQLGVPVGGAGSSFDTLYRQRLRTVLMSDDAYRRYTEAQVWVNKLKDALSEEIGDKGELITIKGVVSASKEDADAVLARVKGGEDLGSVAQSDSTDLTSRQNNGVFDPEPARLLPDNVRAAIEGKPEGSELLGPIEVSGNYWVFRIEKRDPEGVYTETQKSQLADLALADAVKDKRPQVNIKRTINNDDYNWVNDHVGK
ncbi:MAG: SurA N-terminal domain-containing protein [Dehalococcoidia bacterium]